MAVVEMGEENEGKDTSWFPDDVWFVILRQILDERTRNSLSLVSKKFYLLERSSRAFVSLPFFNAEDEVLAKELFQRYPNLRHVAARLSRAKRPGRGRLRTDGDRLLRLLSSSSTCCRRLQCLEISVSDLRVGRDSTLSSFACERGCPPSFSTQLATSGSWYVVNNEDILADSVPPTRKQVVLRAPSLEIFCDTFGSHIQVLNLSKCALGPEEFAVICRRCKRLEVAVLSCNLSSNPSSSDSNSLAVPASSTSYSNVSQYGQDRRGRLEGEEEGVRRVGREGSNLPPPPPPRPRRRLFGPDVDVLTTCVSNSLRYLILRSCHSDRLVLALVDTCPNLRALTLERCPLTLLFGLGDSPCFREGGLLEELTLSRLYLEDVDANRTFMEWRGWNLGGEVEEEAEGRGRRGGPGEDECLEAFASSISSSFSCSPSTGGGGTIRRLTIQTESKAPHQESSFSGSGLVALGRVLPRLESLTLSSYCSLKDCQIGLFIDTCSSLRRLSLHSLALFSQPVLHIASGRDGDETSVLGVSRASLASLARRRVRVKHTEEVEKEGEGVKEGEGKELVKENGSIFSSAALRHSPPLPFSSYAPIEEIDLIRCGNLSGCGFAEAMRGCGYSLRVLRIQDCNLEAAAIAAVARHCKALRTLELRYEEGIRWGGVGSICRGCPRLSEFRLWFCGVLCDEDMRDIALCAREVVTLSVMECPSSSANCTKMTLSQSGVETLLQKGACPRLSKLEVDVTFVSERGRQLARERGVDLRTYNVKASAEPDD